MLGAGRLALTGVSGPNADDQHPALKAFFTNVVILSGLQRSFIGSQNGLSIVMSQPSLCFNAYIQLRIH